MSQENNRMSIAHLLFFYKGRIDRKIYWLSCFIGFIVLSILGFLEPIVGENIVVPLVFPILYIFLPLTIKRLHDTNRSRDWVFWIFVPIVLIVVLCLPGTPGPNQYGESANIGKRKTCKHLTNT